MLEPITEIDGLPLFKITQDLEISQDAAINELFDAGHTMFYLLGSKKVSGSWTDSKKKTHQWTDYRPAIFKVVKNFIGHGVALFDNDIDDLDNIPQTARFTLPPIPASLIDRIDRFFRYVHQQKGTESVVLFTYDPEYRDTDNAQDGWGILVPSQENTAGSCDYDASTVMEDKPDNVRIVGTAHSHPLMSAFCSGTDKGDQMGFDGVHITFGWKSNGPTEFHQEVQMADYGFSTFKDSDIFEAPKGLAVDEEIVAWSKKVTKRTFQTTSTTVSKPTVIGGGSVDTVGMSWDDPARFPNLPAGTPSPRVVTLVWFEDELRADELSTCPVCESNLTDYTKRSQKCQHCSTYIIGADQDWTEYKRKRQDDVKATIYELDEATAKKPIWAVDKAMGVVEIFEGDPVLTDIKLAQGNGEEEEEESDLDSIIQSEWECGVCHIPNNASEAECWMCSLPRDDSGLAT